MWAKLWTKIKGWLFYEELEDVIKLEDELKPVKRALPLTPVTTPLSIKPLRPATPIAPHPPLQALKPIPPSTVASSTTVTREQARTRHENNVCGCIDDDEVSPDPVITALLVGAMVAEAQAAEQECVVPPEPVYIQPDPAPVYKQPDPEPAPSYSSSNDDDSSSSYSSPWSSSSDDSSSSDWGFSSDSSTSWD